MRNSAVSSTKESYTSILVDFRRRRHRQLSSIRDVYRYGTREDKRYTKLTVCAIIFQAARWPSVRREGRLAGEYTGIIGVYIPIGICRHQLSGRNSITQHFQVHLAPSRRTLPPAGAPPRYSSLFLYGFLRLRLSLPRSTAIAALRNRRITFPCGRVPNVRNVKPDIQVLQPRRSRIRDDARKAAALLVPCNTDSSQAAAAAAATRRVQRTNNLARRDYFVAYICLHSYSYAENGWI